MQTTPLQSDIEQRLASAEPEVEVLACEQVGKDTLRLFIDHPAGVDLALCERVTQQLRDLLANYGLEVSSPGPHCGSGWNMFHSPRLRASSLSSSITAGCAFGLPASRSCCS